MKTEMRSRPVPAGEIALLADLLDREEAHYRRLLRLAWRQNSYMKRQDVDRLEANALDWAAHLPPANAARLARETFSGRMAEQAGIPMPPGKVEDLLARMQDTERARIRSALARLRRTVGKLARQNELNRSLAEFCLDLAHHESEIFKRCVLEDPAGCYAGDAHPSGRGPGGVLVRQA